MKTSELAGALLSVQRSLIGEITPDLRGVTLSLSEKKLNIVSYFDGEISEDDKELTCCAETEVMADYSKDFDIKWEVQRVDFPKKLTCLDRWVFLRKENREMLI